MKITSVISEFEMYAITNHIEADWYPTMEAINSAPLLCSLSKESLEERDVEYGISDDLADSFELACRGESDRWKLMRVQIDEGGLLLIFIDLTTLDDERYEIEKEAVVFTECNLTFFVYAERQGNICPDRYLVEFFGEDLDDDRYATIEEWRNEKPYAIDVIRIRREKCFIESYHYD
ncbi:hypothetical protein IKF21_00460 [Candidatus Saccharibacteria bacterium]|nr:hypothetical protein [Candidatus Saccharibacteria bacterium]